jgi:hypothetical protein
MKQRQIVAYKLQNFVQTFPKMLVHWNAETSKKYGIR